MSRYAGVGNNHIVVKSAYKHTVATIEEPSKAQLKKHKVKMQNDLTKKYELIKQLKELGLLDIIWSDNFVEFRKTINGVHYEQFTAWYLEQKKKEKEEVAK